MHGHKPKDFISILFPFPFDQSAQCPTWINFLQETFPEQEVQNLLRASFKWTITPKDSEQPFPYEVAFDVHGPRDAEKEPSLKFLQLYVVEATVQELYVVKALTIPIL